jgi:dTDP-4-dehydrorhamnose 3,5-epimerase
VEFRETGIAGCHLVVPTVHADDRGVLVKTYLESAFADRGLPTHFPEQFYSRSRRGVVRGLHVQLPPAAQDKLVCCVAGEVFDVVVDLRAGSPTYGRHASFSLTAEAWQLVYVPVGLAHGFAAVSDQATMAYLATAEYAPGTDGGIRWDSAGVDWPVDAPVVSTRDAGLPPLGEYRTPFTA